MEQHTSYWPPILAAFRDLPRLVDECRQLNVSVIGPTVPMDETGNLELCSSVDWLLLQLAQHWNDVISPS